MRLSIVNIALLHIVISRDALALACSAEPLVQTRAGKVRGHKHIGGEGDEFCAFKGIPYAKPPIGELRFRDPEPAEPWTGVLDARTFGPVCAQHDWLINRVLGDEDCLYLNVYTTNVEPATERPVMLWVHGGGFTCGSGDDAVYGPDYFMRADAVVLVTVNYRLGIFGFLNLEHELATGNQGMKDQVMALEWVRDNIAGFGGDPNSVTIFGESAGGSAVHLLAISPLTKGLFHRVIIQSGVAINPWAFQTAGEERALRICESLGHKNRDINSVVQFLRTVDAQKLSRAQKTLLTKEEKIQGMFTFVPSVDSKSKNPFLAVHPSEAIKAGIQVPLLIGQTIIEASVFFRVIFSACDRFENEFVELMHPYVAVMIKEYGLTMDGLRKLYFKNDTISRKNVDVLMNMSSDLQFIYGLHKTVGIQVEQSSFPTYFYKFTYDKEPSIFKVYYNIQMKGSCHADDLFFLFRAYTLVGKVKFAEQGSEKYRITEQMIDMWVNFATTGNPTPKTSELIPFLWQPVSNTSVFPAMNICEDLRMETMTNVELKYRVH